MKYFATIKERCDCTLVIYADGRSSLAILNDNSIPELAKL